jgi:thiol-disulfide isomerase/thioredoxin
MRALCSPAARLMGAGVSRSARAGVFLGSRSCLASPQWPRSWRSVSLVHLVCRRARHWRATPTLIQAPRWRERLLVSRSVTSSASQCPCIPSGGRWCCWKAYAVEADIEHGLIAHTPALFVIGPQGREAKVYITQQSYAAVGQFGQILAQEVSSLLPGRPRVRSDLSYAPIQAVTPSSSVALPRAGGGTVRLGPSRIPHLYVFFATWDQEVSGLAGQLDALDRYASSADASGLPALTAVDEASVEPSPTALSGFLGGLPHPLSYPVAIDQSGRVADGYQVLGVPWFVLASPTGHILWYREVSTSGWTSSSALVGEVRAALARAPSALASAAATEQELSGSPAPLASLHQQAGMLLGSRARLTARIGALRGYPIVINEWASWCTPCQAEFGLFAAASARYGRQVGFLGADTDDSPGDARSFLAQHPVSYPSYQTTTSALASLAPIEGLPTTIFINRAGKVVYVHVGQYDSQGALDEDITSYAR